jgi:hypothetical protein
MTARVPKMRRTIASSSWVSGMVSDRVVKLTMTRFLFIPLFFLLFSGCGDEIARFLKCDDVCDRLTYDCLSFLPMWSEHEIQDVCLRNCNDEATAEELDCIERSTCGEIILARRCWRDADSSD